MEIVDLKTLEKNEILKTLRYCEDNNIPITEGAKLLGIGKATLYRKIKEYDIR